MLEIWAVFSVVVGEEEVAGGAKQLLSIGAI